MNCSAARGERSRPTLGLAHSRPIRNLRTRVARNPSPGMRRSLDELLFFLKVDDQGWTLIRAFLVAAMRPGVPCPILVVKGEGAGKTTARYLSTT